MSSFSLHTLIHDSHFQMLNIVQRKIYRFVRTSIHSKIEMKTWRVQNNISSVIKINVNSHFIKNSSWRILGTIALFAMSTRDTLLACLKYHLAYLPCNLTLYFPFVDLLSI